MAPTQADDGDWLKIVADEVLRKYRALCEKEIRDEETKHFRKDSK
jgi:hypothetical protein